MTAKSGPSVMKRSCREGDCLRHQLRHKASGAGLAATSAVDGGWGWDIGEMLCILNAMPDIAELIAVS